MPRESAQLAARLASYKRIILCADGTWLASDLGDASMPSNVARIARTIATSGPDLHGNIVQQIVSYHSGLGAGELPFQKAIYGGIGWGLDNEVCQIYEFISNNYVKGDELFFFGFSRGAFTVRSVAGLVSDIGVLSSQHMSHFTEMWKAYRENTGGQPFRKTAWYQQNQGKLRLENEVRIKVVGVWDTVGALVDNLSGMLTFESVIIEELIQKHRAARAERNALGQQNDDWGCGYIRSNFAGLQGAFFRGLGKQDRTPGNYPEVPRDDKSACTTKESFHPIARIRKTNLAPSYSPAALAGYVIEGPGDGSGGQTGWQWAKKDVLLAMPEYVLRPEKKMTVTHNSDYVSRPSLSRALCPKNLLADLDRHNGIPIPTGETTAI
ncbi:hypothetical protein PENSUB_6117 [Penicillium subrubescens]|uniref:T6SS Phospholipase effector Tle1-like catalytic domain-containing protein n=1 Tax=Penicillium subrubescens TaxID=1316194 RepID=A0A1Q5U3F0_9EURO|nr:hypothetical protein PENSUB_6117 [Penicillium subrubescens]